MYPPCPKTWKKRSKSGVGVMYFTLRRNQAMGNMPIDKIDWELVNA